MMNIGNAKSSNIYIGVMKIQKIYIGNSLVYMSEIESLEKAIELVTQYCLSVGENWDWYRGSSIDGYVDEDDIYFYVTAGTIGSHARTKLYKVIKSSGEVYVK